MSVTDKDRQNAMAQFKKLEDTLFLAMRYVDKHGVIVIPSDSNMPVFSERPSHFCVNGIIMDKDLFPEYKTMSILQMLEAHSELISIYPQILPPSREIVKIAKMLEPFGAAQLKAACTGFRARFCPNIVKYLGQTVIETHGNRELEDNVDLHVLPLYQHGDSFSGISKAFSDDYLSVYRKIKALLNKTSDKSSLIGKCLIAYATENGKFIAALFLDAEGSDDAYYQAVGKLKDHAIPRQMTVGFPMQLRDSGDMAAQQKRIQDISHIFGEYCIYVFD